MQYQHIDIHTNGIRLHTVQAGPENGKAVFLLHGFPEFWCGWRHQIDYLAGQGYRVIAPDQRGYNLSDKPQGVAAYNLDHLAADVIGLIDATGQERVSLVGHDWGAAVAWWTANKYPDRLEKLVILNVPHHRVMSRALRSSFTQIRKSWYFFFFLLPWLPEQVLRRNNWEAFTRVFRRLIRRGSFAEADIVHYLQAWSQPGAITAMINWYRALFRAPPQRLRGSKITVPTLMVWGVRDAALGIELARPSIELCDEGRLVLFDEGTHWIQHNEPQRVNQLIGEFLKE